MSPDAASRPTPPPGAPTHDLVPLLEPDTPQGPLPPKPEQHSPAPVTPTGKELPAERTDMSQQGAFLTTSTGTRLRDTDHSLKAGARGPTLLEDHHLREKITHFDHERIPERVVHARGAGAHGVFVSNGAAAGLTSAGFLAEGVSTPVFVRFSTVLGSRGSADTVRDTRGFATKFYTDEGVFDLVGNNMPVFFIQDGIKFPDVVHAAKWQPDREIPQAQSAHDTFWDFVSLHTEAQHHTIWGMSDRGIPRSYRMMEGFGVHTFRLAAADGTTSLVKFHWKPRLGVHSLVWEEAQMINGVDPDYHRRALYDSIEAGAYPQWELGIQVFPDTEDETFSGIDLLDPTKLVPEELAPVQPIGVMTLNGTPTNFFAESEQVAFHVGHLVPGIGITNDPLLQARLFSYVDTQLSRLGGPNFNQLPINRTHAPVNDMLRDGMHQTAVHGGVAPYKPNTLDGGCPFMAGDAENAFRDVPRAIPAESRTVREVPASFADHFSQARLFWLSLTPEEQAHTVQAYTFELGKCYDENIRLRQVEALARIDQRLATEVAGGLGLPAPEPAEVDEDLAPSPALAQIGEEWPVDGRIVGVLVDETADPEVVSTLVDSLAAAQTVPLLIAPRGGKIWPDRPEVAHRTLLTARSVEFDAAILVSVPPPGPDAVPSLDAKAGTETPAAVDPRVTLLVDELFRHAKAIGIVADVADAAALGLAEGTAGVHRGSADAVVEGLLGSMRRHRVWERFARPA